MTHSQPYGDGRRVAAVTAIFSAPCALAALAMFSASAGGDISRLFDGAAALSFGAVNAQILVFGFWIDIAGFYLILLPLMLYLRRRFAPTDTTLADLSTVNGVIYAAMGAIGAATMASSYEALHGVYQNGEVGEQTAAAAAWSATIAGQWRGVWLIETLAGAIWIGGVGLLFFREGAKLFAYLSFAIAIGWITQFAGHVAGLQSVADMILNIVVTLLPIWALWIGVKLLRE